MSFETAFLSLLNKHEKMIITSGIVSEVNQDSIDVEREGMPPLLDVRFNSVLTAVQNQFKVTPKKGSVVLCGIIESDISEALLIACSEIDKVEVTIDSSEFEIDKDGFKIKTEDINLKDVLESGLNNQNEVNKVLQKVVVAIGASPDVAKLVEIEDSTTEIIEDLLKVLK
ncbi:MAG: hypothetical protein V3V28_08625 [Polaribacter sp.]|uniref:hypothetical protein n=1 Tax=Polaribacter sp. TaxID=1920175 RepID=UPI002F350C1B